MLNAENAKALAEYLVKDDAGEKKLADLSAEEAAKVITADGIEVTADELAEFVKAVKETANQQTGELDEASLDGVSGGISMDRLLFNMGMTELRHIEMMKKLSEIVVSGGITGNIIAFKK